MDMSIKNNKRFEFIYKVLGWEGQINATHIATRYKLSRQAASEILKQYRTIYPGFVEYNRSEKAFVVTEKFNESFNTSKDKYSFSSYLSEVASPHDMSILNNNDITQDIEAPLRNINPIQVRPILRAIREKLKIDIGYISLTNPKYLDRIIQPHTLIFDGLRWHVRAFCNKNGEFRDFTLSRFNGTAVFEGKADKTVEQDSKWQVIVNVVIEADARFNQDQKYIIEKDYQMENGIKTISTRGALVQYLLRRLRVDSFKSSPEQQQIVLTKECRESLAGYLP
jgi:predicted transcriptional regulator